MYRIYKKSQFLTDIAEEYNPKIDWVGFHSLDGGMGRVYRSSNGVEQYRIYLDSEKLPCPNHALHVFYHEVAHVVLRHTFHKPGSYCKIEYEEKEARDWALGEMGTTDDRGNVQPEGKACHECIFSLLDLRVFNVNSHNNKCLRGITFDSSK